MGLDSIGPKTTSSIQSHATSSMDQVQASKETEQTAQAEVIKQNVEQFVNAFKQQAVEKRGIQDLQGKLASSALQSRLPMLAANAAEITTIKADSNQEVGWATEHARKRFARERVDFDGDVLKDGYSQSAIAEFVYDKGYFQDYPNPLMEDLNGKELNTIVNKASKFGFLDGLASVIGEKGTAPSTWKMARKLQPEAWGHLMESYAGMSPRDRSHFAFAFGDSTIKDPAARTADGAKKIAAITVYQAAMAKGKEQIAATEWLGKALDASQELDGLPEPAKKMFEFYAKAARDIPKRFVGQLLSADSPQSSQQKFEEMLNDLEGGFFDRELPADDQLYNHFRQVYTGRKIEN